MTSSTANDPKVRVLPMTNQTRIMMTVIRNKDTPRNEFVFYSDRLFRLLIEEALCFLPAFPKQVITPTGAPYNGMDFESKVSY
jgi:uracil phosphoribosyltransferase